MLDDDLFSMFNNYTSTTDTEEDSSASAYNPSSYDEQSTSTSYNPYLSDNNYQDDYSTTQNYEEQSSYDSRVKNVETEKTEEQRFISKMHTPVIKKEEEAVVLTKRRAKVYLQARMKIILAMFIAIVSALLFVSIFNFVNAGKINATLAEKQITINELKSSISGLKSEYNLMSDDGYMRQEASNSGFVESSDSNTTVLEYGEIYTEPEIEELPSNWFNDVCDFFSKLFA